MSNQFREVGGSTLLVFSAGYPFDAQGSVDILNSYFDQPAVNYYGVLKRWNGSAWVKAKLKTWTGSSWDLKPLNFYDGAQFRIVDTLG